MANLLEIAAELNIDPSAMVFVDDNPAECELIRQQLPQIRVLQMDGDPAYFIRRLDSQNLFHSQRFSAEDLDRTSSYKARTKSEELKRQTTDLNSYLTSLEMNAKVERVVEAHLPRLAQMELKTNQFNLSTRRLSLEQIREMANSDSHIVLAVSLSDRFTDHGLVAYVAAEFGIKELRISDWLMSCRVFSRTLEHFTMNHLVSEARNRGAKRIVLEFVPTAKNGVMVRVFESMGWTSGLDKATGTWILHINENSNPSELDSFIN